jgi:predicted transcriptional regulator
MTTKRVSVSLDDQDVKRLEQVKQETSRSEAEVLRRALATEAFVQRTLEAGGQILVKGKDGSVHAVEFVR